MGVYRLSRKAESDLAKMYEYGIEAFGLSQAKLTFWGCIPYFQVLAENTTLGRDASELMIGLKRFSYKAHTIFYKTTDKAILIVRVLSQRMDYEESF